MDASGMDTLDVGAVRVPQRIVRSGIKRSTRIQLGMLKIFACFLNKDGNR
jgi:hypothetical protein